MSRRSCRRAYLALVPCALLAASAVACAGASGTAGGGTGVLAAQPAAAVVQTPRLSPSEPLLVVHRAPTPDFKPSAVYRWLDILLEASGRDVDRFGARPPILSRTMAIVVTAMYDAWAAYDGMAIGTRLGGSLRRPAQERTQANQTTAIAYAAYRTLIFVYPDDVPWIRGQMQEMGFDPDNASEDVQTPAGIGNKAAAAVIEFRRRDGANQMGDEPGGERQPYADYTGYRPKNRPEHIADPTRWFPIPFSDGNGGTQLPGFLAPQWYAVKPFALERGDQFRPPPPPAYGSEWLRTEVEEAIDVAANLTLEQKAIVEFMRDGPRSTGQSGHWLQFAQDVSRREQYGMDQDIKLFFSVANVVFDAFIASWDAKRYYDTGRPYWWVRIYHKGGEVEGWMGPGKGVGRIRAEQWHAYSPATFVTPPFPGYTSGHATASAAASRILELSTGSDRFGAVAIQTVGHLTEAEYETSLMQARNGKPATDVPVSKEIRLVLPTFTATAEMAAMSRLWGGYHIRTDNDAGLILGRDVAMYSWPKYRAYFDGVVPNRRTLSAAIPR